MQANEETWNRSPLMITLKRDEKEVETVVERRGRWKKEDSLAAPGEKKEEDAEDAGSTEEANTTAAPITERTAADPEKMETSLTDTEKQRAINSNVAKSKLEILYQLYKLITIIQVLPHRTQYTSALVCHHPSPRHCSEPLLAS